MNSSFLDSGVARDAIESVLPMIESLILRKVVHRSHLHIVVLDPVSGRVLYEHSLGDPTTWEYRYDQLARAKASLAFKHRMNSREVVLRYPHLLSIGEVLHAGGIWLDGIVVAASGFKSEWDEAVCYAIAGILLAWAQQRYRILKDHDGDYASNFPLES